MEMLGGVLVTTNERTLRNRVSLARVFRALWFSAHTARHDECEATAKQHALPLDLIQQVLLRAYVESVNIISCPVYDDIQ